MRRQNQKRVVLPKKSTQLRQRSREVSRPRRGATVYQHLKQRNPNAHICIIRSLGGIGDILMTTPAIRHLKEQFPRSVITYATDFHSTDDYKQILKNAPFIDELIDARYVNKSLYESVIDITSVCIKYENSSARPMNRIDIFARACGIPKVSDPKSWYLVEHSERVWANQKIRILCGHKSPVFLHTASFDKKRCWPARRYHELLELTAEQRPDIHYLVSDFNNVLGDSTLYPNCSIVTDRNVRNIAALIEGCKYFIGPDSGPMHIAGAVGTPSSVLFGSIPPEARINHYPTHKAVVAEPRLSCMGCFYARCDISFKCMSDITAQQVLSSVPEILL